MLLPVQGSISPGLWLLSAALRYCVSDRGASHCSFGAGRGPPAASGVGRHSVGALCSKPEMWHLRFAAISEGIWPLFVLQFACVVFCLGFAALAGRGGLSEVPPKIQKN